MALGHHLKIYIAFFQIDSADIAAIIINVLRDNSYLCIGNFLPEGVSCLRTIGLIIFRGINAIQSNGLVFTLRVYDSQGIAIGDTGDSAAKLNAISCAKLPDFEMLKGAKRQGK